MEKKILRAEAKKRLESLSDQEKKAYSQKIAATLFDLPVWRNAKVIGITISRGDEVNTSPIIERAWCEGKQVCVPKCYSADKRMEFRELQSFEQLESVYFGLLEPIESLTKKVSPEEIELMIVPGVCFARNGYRIGYGGGYYDRYLQHFSRHTISLAYNVQMIETVPHEKHDIPVQMIITNEEVIVCHD